MSLLTERYAAWLKMTPLERVIDRAVDAYIRFYYIDNYSTASGIEKAKTYKAKEIEWHELQLLIKVLEEDLKWQANPDVPMVSDGMIKQALHERALARQAENEAAT